MLASEHGGCAMTYDSGSSEYDELLEDLEELQAEVDRLDHAVDRLEDVIGDDSSGETPQPCTPSPAVDAWTSPDATTGTAYEEVENGDDGMIDIGLQPIEYDYSEPMTVQLGLQPIDYDSSEPATVQLGLTMEPVALSSSEVVELTVPFEPIPDGLSEDQTVEAMFFGPPETRAPGLYPDGSLVIAGAPFTDPSDVAFDVAANRYLAGDQDAFAGLTRRGPGDDSAGWDAWSTSQNNLDAAERNQREGIAGIDLDHDGDIAGND